MKIKVFCSFDFDVEVTDLLEVNKVINLAENSFTGLTFYDDDGNEYNTKNLSVQWDWENGALS